MTKIILTILFSIYGTAIYACKCTNDINSNEELSAWKNADAVIIAIPIEGHNVREKLPEDLTYSLTKYEVIEVLSGDIEPGKPLFIHQYVHHCNELVELKAKYLMRLTRQKGKYLTNQCGRILVSERPKDYEELLQAEERLQELQKELREYIRLKKLKSTVKEGDKKH